MAGIVCWLCFSEYALGTDGSWCQIVLVSMSFQFVGKSSGLERLFRSIEANRLN